MESTSLLNGNDVGNQKRQCAKESSFPSIKKLDIDIDRKKLLNVCDPLLCALFFTPIIVGAWASTWVLVESIYPHFFPIYESLWLSTCIVIVFYVIREILQHSFIDDKSHFSKHFLFLSVKIVYVYVFFLCIIVQWRAGWALIDIYITAKGIWTMLAVSGGCLVVLCFFKGLKNTVACPFVLGADTDCEVFDFPSRFRIGVGEKTSLYILDCLFSVLVIGTLVVFVWRGVWVLFDILLLPENEVWSSWSSLVLGYVLVAVAFLLQPAMKWLCDRLQGAARLIAVDVFLLLSLVATVNVWRGIWNLLNIYLLPDNVELGCWITHVICFFLLVLMGCSNSLLVRGVYIDAEEPQGKCVVFPCYYLRVIFQEERTKKVNQALQHADSRRQDNELNCVGVAVIDLNCKSNNRIEA